MHTLVFIQQVDFGKKKFMTGNFPTRRISQMVDMLTISQLNHQLQFDMYQKVKNYTAATDAVKHIPDALAEARKWYPAGFTLTGSNNMYEDTKYTSNREIVVGIRGTRDAENLWGDKIKPCDSCFLRLILKLAEKKTVTNYTFSRTECDIISGTNIAYMYPHFEAVYTESPQLSFLEMAYPWFKPKNVVTEDLEDEETADIMCADVYKLGMCASNDSLYIKNTPKRPIRAEDNNHSVTIKQRSRIVMDIFT